MKKIVLLLALLCCGLASSQNEQLAQNYFDKGEFDKARLSYEALLKTQPYNQLFFQRIVECYQQLEQYSQAEQVIESRIKTFQQANLWVELGYNYQLQKDTDKAQKYYEKAFDKIIKFPNEVYLIANAFERHSMFENALKAYQSAQQIEPNFNFNFQMALLYGQLGNTDMMIEMFLTEAQRNPQNNVMIQNQLTRFMTEDADVNFNESLRKALLMRAQKSQDLFWNEYLSWFYVQQKEYGKAFMQQKAIYRRNPETFANIVNLAQLCIEEGDKTTAADIFGFVLENTQDVELKIHANTYLMQLKIDAANAQQLTAIDAELDGLLKQFGVSPYSLPLQILQAHFKAFQLSQAEVGKTILKTSLNLPLNEFQKAEVKMELADIYLLEEKFSQAQIYYAQIEEDLKNDTVGHEASFKAARTSYFKTDFSWAQKQFKELKSASSQLIANDALEYFLLINDNTVADSTQTALKQFAKADFLLYQNKNQQALEQFQAILKSFKGQEIEPVALYRLGKVYEKLGDYASALSQYQTIIDHYKDGIYMDEAYYFSAEIYHQQLKDVAKAKALYEQIIFNHQDSIYFTDARRKFRELRGDSTL